MEYIDIIGLWLLAGLVFGILGLGLHHTNTNPLLRKIFRERDTMHYDMVLCVILVVLPPVGLVLTIYRLYALISKYRK